MDIDRAYLVSQQERLEAQHEKLQAMLHQTAGALVAVRGMLDRLGAPLSEEPAVEGD